jgi:predicted PurR-regulated permease PerM
LTTDDRRLYLAALGLLTALLGYLAYRIVQPFLVPLAWAAVLAVLFYPLHAFALRVLKRRTATALLSTAVILALIIGPVTALSVLLAAELKTLAEAVRADRLHVLSGLPARAEIEAWLERVGAFLAGGASTGTAPSPTGSFNSDRRPRRGSRAASGIFLGPSWIW